MTGFAEELIDESIGASSKKWALMLLALVAGAVAALWLTGRAEFPDAAPPATGATSEPREPPSTVTGPATGAGKIHARWSRPSSVGVREMYRSGRRLVKREAAKPAADGS